MNILILGSGGREHSLAWATLQNPKCDKLIVAPGNAGIAQIAECAALDIENGAAVVNFCEGNAIEFVIVEQDGQLVVQNRRIRTGEVRAGRVEILDGLQAGEQVVSAGQVKLRNGQAVNIDNSVTLDGKAGGG